MSRTKNIY